MCFNDYICNYMFFLFQCYGTELGLTSDDEDYISPNQEDDKLSCRLSVESFSEVIASLDTVMDHLAAEEKMDDLKNAGPPSSPNQSISGRSTHTPTENFESETDKPIR